MNAEKRGFFTILGDETSRGGSYLLHVELQEPVTIQFGRFNKGQPIAIPAVKLIYVGSAMGQKGSSSLARRLLRHATRTGKRPFHPIRDHMQTQFPSVGLANTPLKPPTSKKLHWHVDYLLDEETAVLHHVTIIRSHTRLESSLARLLMDDPATAVIHPGLGASDASGETHLLQILSEGESGNRVRLTQQFVHRLSHPVQRLLE